MIKVWPSGWVSHAVRAPGSNVTPAPGARAGSGGWNRGSTRTVPVKYSAGPLPKGCERLLLISISFVSCLSFCHPICQTARTDTPVLGLLFRRGFRRTPSQELAWQEHSTMPALERAIFWYSRPSKDIRIGCFQPSGERLRVSFFFRGPCSTGLVSWASSARRLPLTA